MDEAKSTLAEARRLNPNLTVKSFREHAEDIPIRSEGLRKCRMLGPRPRPRSQPPTSMVVVPPVMIHDVQGQTVMSRVACMALASPPVWFAVRSRHTPRKARQGPPLCQGEAFAASRKHALPPRQYRRRWGLTTRPGLLHVRPNL